MFPLITSVVAAAYRRRGLTLLLVVALSALAALAATRVRFDSDVLSLLPHQGRIIPAFRRYVAAFGGIEDLYVVFTAGKGRSISDYQEEIDGWTARLRSAPEFAQVDAGLADGTRNFGLFADRELLLLHGAPLEAALAHLTPQGLTAAVAARRELLALPSPEVAGLVRQDPAGLSEIALGTAGGSGSPNLARGYVSADGRRQLLIVRPTRPPFDTTFSKAVDRRLQEIASAVPHVAPDDDPDDAQASAPLDVAFAGGHRIAIETEAVVKRESISNTVGSLVLILPLLFLLFRSVWLVLVGPLPSALSLVFVGGVLGLAGITLSAAAAGAAAMMFGLGIDGVVLLYVTHRLASVEGSTADERLEAVAGPSSSMLLGMWTTAATFYGLVFVDVPSLQQLGLLIGHSMMACGLLTLVLVPALLPRQPRANRRALTMPGLAAWIARRRTMLLVSAGVLTIVLGTAATGLRINPTLDRLRSVTPAAQLQDQLGPIFGLPSDVYVLLAEGPDLEPLLEAGERVVDRLSKELPGMSVQPPTRILPSQRAQAASAARVAEAALTVDEVRRSLDVAADAAGFRAGSFQPFVDRLPRLLDTSARLTFDELVRNNLGEVVRRFIVRDGDRWLTATYLTPTTQAQVDDALRIVAETAPDQVLTGLPMVNRDLAATFAPQFLKGLAIGTIIVLVLVGLAFRNWRLCAYAMLPTIIGLLWAAGVLALLRVELDLFAVFAVVTFIGVGVDYGIHLVHRYQERADAQRATSELAPVILVAAAITFLGYGTLFNSAYPPLRSIGVVSAVSVFTLALASVLVLPALLMGRRQ